MNEKPRLGFIGIGIMGTPMVRRLLSQGFEVAVWNRDPAKLEAVVPHGAVAKTSPAELAASCDIVLMCILDGPAVDSVCHGSEGLAQTRGGARLVVDMSTINPDETLDIAGRLERANGMRWIDAPVSGGPSACAYGTLTIMLGGEEADVEAVLPALEALAANITRMGPLGAGQKTKIVNQAIVGVGFVLMAEMVALAEAACLEADKLPACLKGGMADSTVLQRIYTQQVQRDFDPPRSYARQLNKDLKNIQKFVAELGLDLPIVERAAQRYRDYVEQGGGMTDSAAVSRLYERQ